MYMKTALALLVVTALLNIILLKLFRQKQAELRDTTRLYSHLAGATGFDTLIKILAEEIDRRGVEVIGFYRKNALEKTLEGENVQIPLFEKSSAVKAFFTLSPCKLGSYHERDRALAEALGPDTVFIPVRMEKDEPCWKARACAVRGCAAYGKEQHACWLRAGKIYKGVNLPTHNEKLAKCISCKSFLPVGVFAVRGRRIKWVHTFITNHFSGALRNSVLYERAVYSASMDSLTKVFNRRSLEEHLLNAFKSAERYGQPLSLAMFDIDHFKKFNDTYGHQAGDSILRELAGLVSAFIREADILARYGGEEFCLVFPHTDKMHAFEITERIRAEIEENIFSAGRRVTVSMGVAGYPDDETAGAKALLKKADIALYRSKITRNTVTSYSEAFQDEGTDSV